MRAWPNATAWRPRRSSLNSSLAPSRLLVSTTRLGLQPSAESAPLVSRRSPRLLPGIKTTSRSFGIDSHPDVGTGESQYPVTMRWPSRRSPGTVIPMYWRCFPATITPRRVALVGLHSCDDDYPNIAEWGLQSVSPNELRESSTV